MSHVLTKLGDNGPSFSFINHLSDRSVGSDPAAEMLSIDRNGSRDRYRGDVRPNFQEMTPLMSKEDVLRMIGLPVVHNPVVLNESLPCT